MNRLRILAIASAILLVTIFTGAMLFIGVSIIPFWQSLPPSEFPHWFATNAHFIGNFMIPLGASSLLISIISLILNWRASGRGWLVVTTAAIASTFLVYAFEHSNLNATLLAGVPMEEAKITDLIILWRFWHWVRTALGFVASISTISALKQISCGIGQETNRIL